MKIPNPLPYDPRPSKAHEEHREVRKKLEKEHPGFNWLPIGLLALMGVTLAMNIEKDVKKCEERKDREPDEDESRKQRSSKRRDDRDRGDRDRDRDRGQIRDRPRTRDRSWERSSRAGDRRDFRDDCSCDGRSYDGRPCEECDYDYRPRRRSRDYRR